MQAGQTWRLTGLAAGIINSPGHAGRPRRVNWAQPGFTLIELMVVVTLVGILTALIIPEMKGSFQAALLRSTSRDLINVCDLTYSRAVSLNQVRRLRLEEKTGRYAVEKRVVDQGAESYVPVDDSGCSGQLNPKISMTVHRADEADPNTPPEAPSPVPPPATGDFSEAGSTIAFYPDGTADPAVIELADQDGFRVALRINPITARIHIEEWERK